MHKFGNISKWQVVAEAEEIIFPVARSVRMQVSGPSDLHFFVRHKGEAVASYLCTTSGRDVLEFTATAGMALIPSEVMRYYSSEVEEVHISETGKPAFVRLANRQSRNPELEMVARIAAENATRRMEQMHYEEMRRRDAQIADLMAKGGNVDADTGEIDGGASGAAGAADVGFPGDAASAASGGVVPGAGGDIPLDTGDEGVSGGFSDRHGAA